MSFDLDEGQRAAIHHQADETTMAVLDPHVLEALSSTLEAAGHVVALLVDEGVPRHGAVGTVVAAVVTSLSLPAE